MWILWTWLVFNRQSKKQLPRSMDICFKLLTHFKSQKCPWNPVKKAQQNMTKHILLSMAFRHIGCSAEVFLASHLSTVILNRLAHVSNSCFLLELESALAKAVAQTSHLLISNIVQNPFLASVFNSDINNFN